MKFSLNLAIIFSSAAAFCTFFEIIPFRQCFGLFCFSFAFALTAFFGLIIDTKNKK